MMMMMVMIRGRRNCYFQTKIDSRRRSIYVRMHDAILTLGRRLLPNYR